MNIELIDVTTHSEKEVIAEINKIVPILIERYNGTELENETDGDTTNKGVYAKLWTIGE